MQHQPPIHESSVIRRRRPLSWVLVVVAVVLALVVFALVALASVVNATLDGRDALERARGHILSYELEEAQAELGLAEVSFARARRSAGWLAPARVVPGLSKPHDSLVTLLASAETTSGVLVDLVEVAEDVVRIAGGLDAVAGQVDVNGEFVSNWSQLDRSTRLLLLDRLHHALPELEVNRSEIRLVVQDLRRVRGRVEQPLMGAFLDEAISAMETLETGMDAFVQVAAFVPAVIGDDGSSRILVLFLNNDEMRPGGGFIGSFGVVELDAGLIESTTTYDVLAVDSPVLNTHVEPLPPGPILEYAGVPAWFLRDANWSPDFLVSTEKTLELMRAELDLAGDAAPFTNTDFHAVVGVTSTVLGDVLQVVGDIPLKGEVYTPETAIDILQYEVEIGFAEDGIDRSNRKDLIGELLNEIRARVDDFQPAQWNALLSSLGGRLTDKQIVFFSQDPVGQSLIESHNWAGRVSLNPPADYLMVVDANLAALKTDPAVDRTITYTVQPVDGHLIAEARVRYDHTQSFDWKTTRYRTYTRFYVPLGSELLSTEGSLTNDKLSNPSLLPDQIDVTEELGKTVFGMFTSIEPLESRELVVRYRLPDTVTQAVESGTYHLLTQKQIGAANHDLQLNLNLGQPVRSAEPAEIPSLWGDMFYQVNTKLDQDRAFTVQL